MLDVRRNEIKREKKVDYGGIIKLVLVDKNDPMEEFKSEILRHIYKINLKK